jgi:hypothetical protein
MERAEFMSAVTMPGFSDEMDFVLRVPEEVAGDDKTFSSEGIGAMTANVHDYVMGSVIRRWRETGKPAHGVTVRVKLDWDGPSDDELEGRPRPWWGVDDASASNVLLDGSYRWKAWTRHG